LFLAVDGVAAHAELVVAEPEPGAQLTDAPVEIRLTFSEPVAARSNIVVLGDGFAPVEGLIPQFSPDRPEQVYVPLPSLEPGTYTVQWTAVSSDGHEISGSYSFSIGQIGGTTATIQQSSEQQTVGIKINGWILAFVTIAFAVPFVLLWYRRRS
jgi:methionine-rich copper-binding protein CopC